MTAPRTVGIVGIGAMGWPMACHLQRLGHPPFVRDIDPRAQARAVAQGLKACRSPAELAQQCETVLVVVVDASQIDDVLFDDDGLVQADRPADAPRQTVVLCSTIAPEDTVRFHASLLGRGIDAIDAPISGGPARADAGTLSMMVAARRDVYARGEPLLRQLASSVHFIGERIGDAARTKLVNNLLAGVNLAAGAEAFALGLRLGLDRRALFEVIRSSSGASWIFNDRMTRALDGDFEPRARTRILTKDVRLAIEMARAAGVRTPLGQDALAAFQAAIDAGFGDDDDAALVKSMAAGF